jgi:hypothetical protein
VKKLSRRAVCLALTLLVVAWPGARSFAQQAANESAPAVVVSVASIDRLLSDIGYLTRAAGMPQMGGFVTLVTSPYLAGLDTKRPSGMLVTFSGEEPSGVAFVAVTDFEAVLKRIEEQVGPRQDVGGGIVKFSVQRDIFLKQQAGWAFVSDKAAHLANLPQDPSQYLIGLDKQYTLAVRVNGRSIPPQMKQAAIAQVQQDLEGRLERELADKPEQERQQAEQMMRTTSELLVSLIQDVDQVTLGWGTDSQGGTIFLEKTVTGQPGTKLAEHMAKTGSLPSPYAGFQLPDAAVSLSYSLAVPTQVAAAARPAMADLRQRAMKGIDEDRKLTDEKARTALKEAVNGLLDVLQTTLEQGRLQGGAAIMLAPGAARFAAGGFVADGAKVEQAVRKLVEAGRTDPNFPEVQFNAATHADVRFHTATVEVPADEQEARKVFGPQLDVAIGTGKQTAYAAAGQEALALLKQVIDGSGAETATGTPLDVRVSLAPILTFASQMDNDPTVTAMAGALRKTNGRDDISLTARSIERGVVYRLAIEEGILSLIGETARMSGTAGDAR